MADLQSTGDVDADVAIPPELQMHSTETERLLVENARLRAEMLAAAARMERLQALIAGLARAVTRADAFTAVTSEGMRAFDATTATVTLLTEDKTALEINHS